MATIFFLIYLQELAEAEEVRVNNRVSLIPDESSDLYAQAFGSFLLNPNQLTCNYPDHHTKAEMDQLQAKVDTLVSDATVQLEEMEKLTKAASQSQVAISGSFCLSKITSKILVDYFPGTVTRVSAACANARK